MAKTSKLAFPNVSGKVFHSSNINIGKGIASSRKSRRRRILLPLHRSQEDKVQRLINFLQPGTYIRPHKHPGKHDVESIIVMRGSIQFIIFDDIGFIENHFTLQAGTDESLIDIEPGVWHSFIVLEKDTVIFEVKKGPYNSLTDKEFAFWSPVEYTDEASKWVESMEKMNE
ncbi:MAG: WbuC family cupin fold metalloprotein [Rhodothermaceae bacterium]|nr:WbuC family cupin fold metalloprotein [Rhodothermaceae bacterium]